MPDFVLDILEFCLFADFFDGIFQLITAWSPSLYQAQMVSQVDLEDGCMSPIDDYVFLNRNQQSQFTVYVTAITGNDNMSEIASYSNENTRRRSSSFNERSARKGFQKKKMPVRGLNCNFSLK